MGFILLVVAVIVILKLMADSKYRKLEAEVLKKLGFSSSESGKEAGYLSNSLFFDLSKIDNLEKLEHMSHFQADWNGTGGLAFSRAAIGFFREIINNLRNQPQIAPTGRNSLLLQYELGDRSLLAFEVREDRVEMVCVPKGNYSLATSKVFTDNYVQQIDTQVACFYGLK